MELGTYMAVGTPQYTGGTRGKERATPRTALIPMARVDARVLEIPLKILLLQVPPEELVPPKPLQCLGGSPPRHPI